MRIGDKYTFVPHAFGAEVNGKAQGDNKPCAPRRVTGRICYINWDHQYFTVLAEPKAGRNKVRVRESFKFSEYRPG